MLSLMRIETFGTDLPMITTSDHFQIKSLPDKIQLRSNPGKDIVDSLTTLVKVSSHKKKKNSLEYLFV